MRRIALALAVAFLSACTAPNGGSGAPGGWIGAGKPPAATAASTAPATLPSSTPVTAGCIIERFEIPSKLMAKSVRVAVLVPPAYAANPAARFPVLYALHGMGAPYDTFTVMTTLQRAIAERPTIVVCFDGSKAGWYIDSPKVATHLYTRFFFEELMPAIEQRFRTQATPQSRGITGFSMGGFGAMHLMLEHPERFSSVSSLSGVYDVHPIPGGKRNEVLETLLGNPVADRANYDALSIGPGIARRIREGVSLPPMLLHCGTSDRLIGAQRVLATFLLKTNADATASRLPAPVTFQAAESPGAHNWPFWRDAAPGILDFHWRAFNAPRPVPTSAPAPATRPSDDD